MEVCIFGSAVSLVALVGLRKRQQSKAAVSDEGSASKTSPPSREYLNSLLVPCFIAALYLTLYYFTPQVAFDRFKPYACRGPTPEERAALWQYSLDRTSLKNVSHEDVARRLFSQGLIMRFGYSEEGARTSFSAASEVDPTCAMCYWGLAYAVAPFVNIVALPDGTRHPYYSLEMNREARAFLSKAKGGLFRSRRHQAYVDAMWIRFPEVKFVERRHQEWREFLYGAKMIVLFRDDPSDVMAAALAAEAFVNCHPWDFHVTDSQPSIDEMTWSDLVRFAFPKADVSKFESVTGMPSSDKVLTGLTATEEVLDETVSGSMMRPIARLAERLVLEVYLTDNAHPLATHLHIHLLEATKGTNPTKALPSALKLDRVSRRWKSGHLIHMPSHIYFRVGEHQKSVDVNEAATQVDRETSESCVDPYVPEHNLKLLVASASMGGLLNEAEKYALKIRSLREEIKMTKYMSPGWDYSALLDVWGHFGRWEKILSAEAPSVGARGGGATGGLEYSQSIYFFHRAFAISHTAKNSRRLLASSFETEMQSFLEAAKKVPDGPVTIPGEGIGIYASGYKGKTKINELYIQARNASLHRDLTGAIEFLKSAVSVAQEMGYMEPPWPQQPPKQCLAYLLMVNKQYSEAKRAFEEDLIENMKNPWSMIGSAQVAKAMGNEKEAEDFLSMFESTGSVKLKCSCPMLFME